MAKKVNENEEAKINAMYADMASGKKKENKKVTPKKRVKKNK